MHAWCPDAVLETYFDGLLGLEKTDKFYIAGRGQKLVNQGRGRQFRPTSTRYRSGAELRPLASVEYARHLYSNRPAGMSSLPLIAAVRAVNSTTAAADAPSPDAAAADAPSPDADVELPNVPHGQTRSEVAQLAKVTAERDAAIARYEQARHYTAQLEQRLRYALDTLDNTDLVWMAVARENQELQTVIGDAFELVDMSHAQRWASQEVARRRGEASGDSEEEYNWHEDIALGSDSDNESSDLSHEAPAASGSRLTAGVVSDILEGIVTSLASPVTDVQQPSPPSPAASRQPSEQSHQQVEVSRQQQTRPPKGRKRKVPSHVAADGKHGQLGKRNKTDLHFKVYWVPKEIGQKTSHANKECKGKTLREMCYSVRGTPEYHNTGEAMRWLGPEICTGECSTAVKEAEAAKESAK